MSYDLCFWKSAVGTPGAIYDRLADEEVEGVEPSPEVERFRTALLERWPDLADSIAPWARDLAPRQPWGRADLGAHFVLLTLSYGTEAATVRAIVALADEYGLVVHDPQTSDEMR